MLRVIFKLIVDNKKCMIYLISSNYGLPVCICFPTKSKNDLAGCFCLVLFFRLVSVRRLVFVLYLFPMRWVCSGY